MYHYIKKAEAFSTPSATTASQLGIAPSSSDYGLVGPLKVSFGIYVSRAASLWISALGSLGVPLNNHPLAGNNVGAQQQPSSINRANITRSYSAVAYLAPNSGRKNLKVLTSALARRIVWDNATIHASSGVVATGVEFTHGGKIYTVKAKKEVILSSGAVNTPQLLELSGIGSTKVLAAAGVKQIIDLPGVGENLQDHTCVHRHQPIVKC